MHRCVRHGEQGGALIVALAVLAVFSCMAVTFCTVMRIEGAASTNHLLGTRAAMIAEAGVHRAVAELAASELDDPTGRSGGWLAQDHGTPIETTTDLSWPRQDDLGPYTGLLGGTFVSNGDRYLVRVADTSSRIDLGARPDFLGPALDALGRAIALNTPGRRDPVRGRGAEAAALVRARGGVRSIREIEAFLGTEDAAILADYTTTHAVRDPRTTSWTGEVDERGYPVFASDPRAPISVNTASWPVLVAVLTGVIGADGAPVTFEQARILASCITAWRENGDADRGPLTTWDQVGRLIDGAATSAALTPGQRDALLANASPNLVVGELIPDATALAFGDGGAILRRTTELSLLTSGIYEIDAVGRILAPAGGVAAEARIHAVARIFSVARHTSQEDFARGDCNGVTAMPNPGAESPTPYSGYVQLAPRASALPEVGAVLDFGRGTLNPTFVRRAGGPVPGGTAAHVPGGNAWGFWKQQGSSAAGDGPVKVTRAPACDGSPTRGDGARTAGPAGALHRDGLRAAPAASPIQYAISEGTGDGTVGLWFKLGRDEVRGTLLEDERTIAAGLAVRSRLIVGRRGDVLELDYHRQLFTVGETRTPAFTAAAARTRVTLGGVGAPNEWHRLHIEFHDGVEHRVFLDGTGLEVSEIVPAAIAPLERLLIVREALAIGGDLAQRPSSCRATIDGLVLGESRAPTLNEDRYGLDATTVGRFVGHFEGLPPGAELGTLSWTAARPTRWGRIGFAEDEFALAVAAMNGGVPVRFGGDGTPVKVGKKKKDGKAQAPKPPKEPKPPKGAKAAPVHATVPQGSLGASDMPNIVQRGDPVDYEFDFIYDRAALRARGVIPPPLDVTPILEDVTLTYSTGPRILCMQRLD